MAQNSKQSLYAPRLTNSQTSLYSPFKIIGFAIQHVIDRPTFFSKKIFNVNSKDAVHECETEFGVLSVTDVIDIRRSFSWSMTSRVTCYANDAKNVTKLFDILCLHS